MPYFITDKEPDCPKWAMVKDDGEVMGCHETKKDAIAHMVAASLAEGIRPGGERSVRAVTVPDYVKSAAARGLELRRDGFGGDGLTDATIREARQMANGEMSNDKTVRANAWAARHAVDLEASKNNNPEDPEWPGAGAVAHYLWGINPLNPEPARNWLERQAEKIKNDERQNKMNVEFRSFDTDIVEVRAAESGNGMTFGGYAARYNSPSLPLPFIEVIAPGAFDRTLKSKNDIRAYINHDERLILGSTRAKTLRLDNRSDGLYSEIDLPDTTYARDLSVSIARGDTRTMSFGFSTVKDEWQDANNRTLKEVRLHEVSVVTGVAAYPATTASVRNLTLIAKRTDTDVDALTDAIAALESGEPLTTDQANVLRVVVDRSAPQQLAEELSTPSVTPLTVLMKQLDLIAKTF